jgi:hypothetical protein
LSNFSLLDWIVLANNDFVHFVMVLLSIQLLTDHVQILVASVFISSMQGRKHSSTNKTESSGIELLGGSFFNQYIYIDIGQNL